MAVTAMLPAQGLCTECFSFPKYPHRLSNVHLSPKFPFTKAGLCDHTGVPPHMDTFGFSFLSPTNVLEEDLS